LPQASDQDFGVGVLIESNIDTGAPATAHLKSSLVERNHMFGVYVGGSEATLEGLVVRGTLPRTIDQHFGRGIQIQLRAATGAPSTANVKSSLVEGNHDIGVLVGASQATLEGLLVRGTLPRASDQQFGMGINIQVDPVGGALASALVKGSLIEESHDSGVFVHGSEATLEGVVIRGTSPRASDSLFGDGLAVATAIVERVPFAASAVVTNSRIEHNARAGLGNFGAHVALRGNALSCNAFDLDREDFGVSSTFEDLDGNGCGCPAPTDTCVARSSGLAPPEPPVDPP
jgi:hypothetical protein